MSKRRVLLLMHQDLVPPEDVKGIEDFTIQRWKTEYDVLEAVRFLGHDVRPLGVYDDLGVIHRAVREWKPHIVFNLLEEFGGEAMLDQNVVSYLEMMRVSYTGCNPLGLMLARDKALSKKLLSYHKIHVPHFQVIPRGRKIRRIRSLRFPVIVKSLVEEASLGISQQSVVADDDALEERVRFVHEKIGTDAILEEFIAGREVYVGVLGNRRLTVFPPWELSMRKQPPDSHLIATRKVKFDTKYQKKVGLRTSAAKFTPEIAAHVRKISKRIFRILNLNGYARIDFRLAEDGEFYFLEANPNPNLEYGEDFAESAETVGVDYDELMKRILRFGMSWKRHA